MDEESSEVNALNVLFANTTIPVPRVRRVFHDEFAHHIAMDKVEGCTLAHVWPHYSLWQKIRVAFTLRRYIRQLRRFCKAPPGTPPGLLARDEQGVPKARWCDITSIFGTIHSIHGPFESYAALASFANKRREWFIPEGDPRRNQTFDDSEPLVLSHLDLNLRNIMIDPEGRVWIIDWEWAGYWPPWFEYIATLHQSREKDVCGTDDYVWKLLIPFICNPYYKQGDWWAYPMRSFAMG